MFRGYHNPNPACIDFPVLLAALVPSRAQGRKRRPIPERRGPYELCEIGEERAPAHTANFCKLYTVHKIDFHIEELLRIPNKTLQLQIWALMHVC